MTTNVEWAKKKGAYNSCGISFKSSRFDQGPRRTKFRSIQKTILSNFKNRKMHHHVFDVSLIKQIFKYLNMELLHFDSIDYDNIFLGKTKKH